MVKFIYKIYIFYIYFFKGCPGSNVEEQTGWAEQNSQVQGGYWGDKAR